MRRAKKQQIINKMRTKRVRAKISGTSQQPRLSIFRSNKSMYVQLIDDASGKTLASASFKEVKAGESKDMSAGLAKAFALGKAVAEKAVKAGVEKAVLDRGRFAYHGRVKALAEGAREGGLKI